MRTEKCADFTPTFDSKRPCLYYIEQAGGRICGLCKQPDKYRCLADLGEKPLPLSHSAVQDFLTCKQLFYMKQVMGLQVRSEHLSGAIKMGVLWDAVLQWYLGNKDINIQNIIDEYSIHETQVAMVRGLYRAYKDLGVNVEEGGKLQAPIVVNIRDFGDGEKVWGDGMPVELLVRGFLDRKYDNYFAENKLSSRPDSYLDVFFIQSQVATYFLADPALEYCVMEVVRTPMLKITKAEELNEDFKGYENRIYADIVSRPAHYFIGWDKDKRTYGKRFYRSEFNLDEVLHRYKRIFIEIHESLWCESWYRNDRACKGIMPGISCDYIGACRYNNASESVYEIRKKEEWLGVEETDVSEPQSKSEQKQQELEL